MRPCEKDSDKNKKFHRYSLNFILGMVFLAGHSSSQIDFRDRFLSKALSRWTDLNRNLKKIVSVSPKKQVGS